MRRSLRFFRSCSSSSLIFLRIPFRFEHEVVASDAAQDHAFEPVQIVEAVTGGFRYSGEHGRARIFADDPQELSQSNGEIAVSALFERGQIICQFRSRLEGRLFFRMWIAAFDALAAGRPVLG